MVLAASGFLAAGMLLYSGEGLVQALSVIMAVQAGSFALGMRVGAATEGDAIDALRRRWLSALLAFLAAALYAGGWSFLGEGASRPLSLGLGLAFLGALPLYGGGGVVGAIVRLAQEQGRSGAFPLAWVAAGGAVGFLLSGIALQPRVFPVTFYMMALVVLSGGSLLEAILLGALESRGQEPDHSPPDEAGVIPPPWRAQGGAHSGSLGLEEPSVGTEIPGGSVSSGEPIERDTGERTWNETSGSGPSGA
jgi:hypothetical protein